MVGMSQCAFAIKARANYFKRHHKTLVFFCKEDQLRPESREIIPLETYTSYRV